MLSLGSTRCSSVDCVGVHPRNQLNYDKFRYQTLDAYTFWDYKESVTNCRSYWNNQEALEAIRTGEICH